MEGKIIKEGFQLDVISVRLVKDASLLSCHRINSPLDAINVVGKSLCDMDREIVCVINLKVDILRKKNWQRRKRLTFVMWQGNLAIP